MPTPHMFSVTNLSTHTFPQAPSQSFPSFNSPGYPRPTYLHTFSLMIWFPHNFQFLIVPSSPPASLCFPNHLFFQQFPLTTFSSQLLAHGYLLSFPPLPSPSLFSSLSLFLFPLTTFPHLKTSSSITFSLRNCPLMDFFSSVFPITAFLVKDSPSLPSPSQFPRYLFYDCPPHCLLPHDSSAFSFSHFPLRPLRHTSSLIPYPYPVSP